MCKLMEDRINERNIELVVDMLTDGGYSYDQIIKLSKLTLLEIKEIEKQLETAKAQ